MDFLYGTQSILFFISTVWLSDTPADSGRSIPPGGVSQHHAHAFSGLITAQQVQNLPECGSAAWLQHLRWSDKGETSSYTYTVSWVSASMVAVSSCTQSVWAALFIKVCIQELSVSFSSCTQSVEDDFVDMRKDDPQSISAEDLHRMLVVARWVVIYITASM